MPTANDALLDALIRHQTYLMRYAGSVRNRVFGMLDATEAEIGMRIRDALRDNVGLTTPAEIRRMQALLKAIAAIRVGAWTDAQKFLRDEMVDLSYQEPLLLQGIFTEVSPVVLDTVLPSRNMLKAIAFDKPFHGDVLKGWVEHMSAQDIKRISAQIQAGMVANDSSTKIAQRVIGTQALYGTDGITELTRRQVLAVVNTAVQHVANTARSYFTQENIDVINAEIFVATLDSKTTPICRSLDGKKFKPGEGPQPPLHINCRSLRTPTLDPETAGTRPFINAVQSRLVKDFAKENDLGSIDNRDDLPRGTKGQFDEWAYKKTRAMIGQVPAQTNYQVWLSTQSKQFQEDTLGVAKAKLFRDGELTLDKFVAANGTELTLEQLAQRHPAAFRAAGLDPSKY